MSFREVIFCLQVPSMSRMLAFFLCSERHFFRDNYLQLFLHRRVLGASLVSCSSMLRAAQLRLLRKPRNRRVPEITLPTVEEDPSLACTSLPPASRSHYCSTQHLHLGFFFRVTCSTCDASPGPCAVILATSTVAVLDDAATFSLTGC